MAIGFRALLATTPALALLALLPPCALGQVGRIYVTDWGLGFGNGRVLSYNLNGGDEQVLMENLGSPQAVRPDVESGRLYVADACGIIRSDLHGANPEQVLDTCLDGETPSDLALNLPTRRMCWPERGLDRIRCADMDGTPAQIAASRFTLLSALKRPDSLDLSAEANLICWTESSIFNSNHISCTALDLSGPVESLYPAVAPGVALSIKNGFVWWTDISTGTVWKGALDGSAALEVVTGLSEPARIVVDEASDNIYYVNWVEDGDSGVWRIPMGHSEPINPGEEVVSGVTSAFGLAVSYCGDGYTHPGLEECDDGNLEDDDGCSSTCQLEECGDGILHAALGEACDDGNLVDGDGCSSTCKIEKTARVCVEAIAKAGANYSKARTNALQKCRNTINKGKLALDPADCATETKTAVAIGKAGAKARKLVAAKCTDELLSFESCAETVDGIVNPAGTDGCLIDSHDAAGEAMLQTRYGTVAVGDKPQRKCQESVAKAGADYAAQRLNAIQKCRSSILRGKLELAAADCATETNAAAAITKAAGKGRARVAKFCTDTLLEAIGPCASSVDGVINPGGDGGCIIDSHDGAVAEMLDAQWGG